MDGLVLTGCPECGAVAEILREDVLPSTAGPVRHVHVACVRRHHFFLPAESLPQPEPVPQPVRTR